MKNLLVMISISLALIMLCMAAYGTQNVGGDFGRLWLQQHGVTFSTASVNNSLWNWGSAPEGYTILNGKLYPNTYGPSWYYPDFLSSSTPIVINRTSTNNTNYISPDLMYEDPWVLAQLTGQPVVVVNNPSPGTLA